MISSSCLQMLSCKPRLMLMWLLYTRKKSYSSLTWWAKIRKLMQPYSSSAFSAKISFSSHKNARAVIARHVWNAWMPLKLKLVTRNALRLIVSRGIPASETSTECWKSNWQLWTSSVPSVPPSNKYLGMMKFQSIYRLIARNGGSPVLIRGVLLLGNFAT